MEVPKDIEFIPNEDEENWFTKNC